MSVNVVDKSTGNLIQVAGKPIQDASNINYDNTTSGLVSTKVQGAIDELNSNVTELDSWTDANDVTVTGNPITISDAAAVKAKALSVSIDPVQDLHGYDKPWVGGAGKNKAYVRISSGETSLTEIKDSDNNVIGVNATMGAQGVVATIRMATVSIENGKTYTLSGSPNDKGNSTYRLDVRTQAPGQLYNNWNEIDNPTITATEDVTLDIYLRIAANYAVNNLVFHPQIEEGSTPTTFAPYTNICPISGHTEASVTNHHPSFYTTTNTSGMDTNSSVELLTADSIRVYNVSNKNYVSSKQLLSNYNLVAGKTYTMEADAEITSGTAILSIRRLNDSIAAQSEHITTSGHLSCTFTMASDMNYMSLFATWDNVIIGNVTYKNIKFYEGEPKTYTIALGDTIYGGTVDFDSGVMTVDRAFFKITNINQIARNATYPTAQYKITAITEFVADSSKRPIADRYATGSGYGTINFAGSTTKVIRITTAKEYESLEAAFEEIDGTEVCYYIEPFTIQLTPQQIQLLKGTNTLTANGAISLTYQQDNLVGEIMEQVDEKIAVSEDTIDDRLDTVEANFANYCRSKYLSIVERSNGITVQYTNSNQVFMIVGKSYKNGADTPFCFAVNVNKGMIETREVHAKDLYGNYDPVSVTIIAGSFSIPLGSWACAFILSSHEFDASFTTSG